ncbi:MAG: D-2-hydroxyacid dehydrogenase [Acidobacteria bacterium]|nr:D-2-hydroxyacid dehydrogenase [Acidobacteriota bacterium]
MKIVVLDGYCLNPGDLTWDGLRAMGELTVHDRTAATDTAARLAGADVAFTNKTALTAELLGGAASLRYVGVLATGYNIVDVASAKARGITVTNIPTYGTASVAQHAFALLLELTQHVGLHEEAVRAGEWASNADWCFSKTPLVELSGKTMGIVGYGRIGRATAAIGRAFGMRILAADAVQNADDVEWRSIEELLREADVVSLHCPLTPETNGLMNAARLRLMKPTAFLLNTSRGPLIVNQDLADALNAGVIAGAGLDVLDVEPPKAGNPLIGAKNCIVTPHMAWATQEARSRLMEIAVENLRAFLAGSPVNVVS